MKAELKRIELLVRAFRALAGTRVSITDKMQVKYTGVVVCGTEVEFSVPVKVYIGDDDVRLLAATAMIPVGKEIAFGDLENGLLVLKDCYHYGTENWPAAQAVAGLGNLGLRQFFIQQIEDVKIEQGKLA